MQAARAEIWTEGLTQGQLDHLLGAGVTIETLMHPTLVTATRGKRAHDGRFDYDPRKKLEWLAFEEDDDFVFWRLDDRAGDELATYAGTSFALGEINIHNPGTYAFDGWLSVWPNPFAWLQDRRRGIVVVDWDRIFDELRYAPRIIGETVLLAERIETLMHPPRLPAIAARVPRRAGQTRSRRE